MRSVMQYRPASHARVLALLAGLAARSEKVVDFHAYLAELTTIIAFGGGSAPMLVSRGAS